MYYYTESSEQMIFEAAPNIVLQANAPGLGMFMLLVSLLGAPEFYLLVIPLILWCYNKSLGLRLLFLLSISAAINAMLKLLFHAPRPYWVSAEVKAFSSEPTFGMPSAAAQISLTFLGYIGTWFKKRSIWIASIVLIVLIGISRMYLGVHFLTDILTGWIFALIILLVFLRYEKPAALWLSQKPPGTRILLAFLASCMFIILAQVVIYCLGTWQVPAGWSALALEQTNAAIDPLSIRDVLMAAGLLFGAAAGAVISAVYIPYVVDGSKSRKAIRYLSGIIILAFLWVALSAPTKSPDLAGYGMAYFRVAIVGVWITAGAPFLFCKTGLANTGPDSPG